MFINKNQKNFRINYGDYLPLWAKVSYNQLALYGVHIGHSVTNLTPYSSWMVLGSRQGLCLINMFKFMYMFRGGLFIIQALIRRRSPIWFINLDQSSQSIIKSAATECGEYWINNNWINGLLTNFRRITQSARRTMKTASVMWTSRQHCLTQNFRHWSLTRYTWPRAVFVSNVLLSYNVCQEAMNLRIPTVGIVDTNSPQKYVNIAVPGNDESFNSVGFYNNLISMFILYNKFSMVNLWYINRLFNVNNNVHAKLKNIVFNVKNYYSFVNKKVKVNLNEFSLTSPVSNIKYGILHHYQDILKTRGIQLMYGSAKPSQLSRKSLIAQLKSFYSKNQIWLHTLRNIYKSNKKWARALKIRRKNRRFKVRINLTRKGSKLYKNAWYFLRKGKIRTSRLLRTQTYNFWKLLPYLSTMDVPKELMFMYRRYLRRVYWFPKSHVYTDFRFNVYNLLSTWFVLQFSYKRTLFSRFFYRSTNVLTSSIKQRRISLRKSEMQKMKKIKRANYKFGSSNKKIKYGNISKTSDIYKPSSVNLLTNFHRKIWYLRIMGLSHSLKRNVFIRFDVDINKPVKLLFFDKNLLISSKTQTVDSVNKTNSSLPNGNYNVCIKYVYNEWSNNNNNSKINTSNLTNYYYSLNIPLFKPLASTIKLNSFLSNRIYYIE